MDNKPKLFDDSYKANFIMLPYTHETVIIPSFHRCGNSLTRELLEGITNILTGSDDFHQIPSEANLTKEDLNFLTIIKLFYRFEDSG